MAQTTATRSMYQILLVLGLYTNIGILATTCPGFPGYCSESFPGQTCVVVCSRGRPNVPLCQEDGTWTDIPRCIEHDPGVDEQIPGLCPGISGYCSDGYLGQTCQFKCPVGPNIDSVCSQDGTWEPYPTCAGDIRDTQDGCDGCPGPQGGPRNRTAEAILGLATTRGTRPPTNDRRLRPSFAGNQIFGPLSEKTQPSTPKSLIPPQQPRSQFRPNNNFIPNLSDAGLRSQTQMPTTQPPRTIPTPRPVAQPPRAQFQPQQPRSQFQPQDFPRTQQPQFPQLNTGRQNNQIQSQTPRFPQQQPQAQPQQPRFQQPQRAQPSRNQPSRPGFTSQQLDIIRNGVSRLNGFNQFAQRQPVQQAQQPQQQPRLPVQQPQQQQPRLPVQQQPEQQQNRFQQRPQQPRFQQQPRVQQQQPQQPAEPVRPQPRRPQPRPQPQPAPAPAPSSSSSPSSSQGSVQLSDLQKSILAAAGISNIPNSIPKVNVPDPSEPRVVDFLVKDEPTTSRAPIDDGRFFGPFEVVDPTAPVPPELNPNLRAFPAIPGGGPRAPRLEDPQFGPFQIIDL